MVEDLGSMQRLTAVGGVEITDIDLSQPLTPALKERILNLFAAHPILVFRNQTLTKEQQFERDYLERLLRLTGGNVSDAARLADRNRTEFYRLLQKHELTPAAFKLE